MSCWEQLAGANLELLCQRYKPECMTCLQAGHQGSPTSQSQRCVCSCSILRQKCTLGILLGWKALAQTQMKETIKSHGVPNRICFVYTSLWFFDATFSYGSPRDSNGPFSSFTRGSGRSDCPQSQFAPC